MVGILGDIGNIVADVWHFLFTLPGGVWSRLTDAQAVVVQTAILGLAGVRALQLYRRRREDKATVRIGATARAASSKPTSRLFVRIHLSNESARLLRVASSAHLFTVDLVKGEFPRFDETWYDFPLDYVYGDIQADGTFADPTGSPVLDGRMEPGECIETEVLFPIDLMTQLMALRITVIGGIPKHLGKYRDRLPDSFPKRLQNPIRKGSSWEMFAYLTPKDIAGPTYVALTSHSDAAA